MLTKVLIIASLTTELVVTTSEAISNTNSFLETIKYLNEFGLWDFFAIICSGVISIVIMIITLRKDKKKFIDERERANRIYANDKLDEEELNRISIMPYFVIDRVNFTKKDLTIIFEVTFENLGNGTAAKFAPNKSDNDKDFNLIKPDSEVWPNEVIRPNAKSKKIQMAYNLQESTPKTLFKAIDFSIKYTDMKGRVYLQYIYIQLDLAIDVNEELTTCIYHQDVYEPILGIEL